MPRTLNRNHTVLLALACLLVAFISVFLNFSGFQGYIDDTNYVGAAFSWLHQAPYVGENHWHNRLPFVLSLTGALKVFGAHTWATAIPSLLCYLLLGSVVFVTVRRFFDAPSAAVATMFVLSVPLFAIYASIPYPLMMETCLAGSAILLFILAVYGQADARPPSPGLLLTIGLVLGLGSLIRPYTISILLILLVMFLAGRGMPRSRYWWIAGGLVFVVGAEFVFYYLVTGDPFTRLRIDAQSNTIPSSHLRGGVFTGIPFFNPELMSRWVPNSPVPVHWTVDPYINLFLSGTLGFLFWIAALMVILWRNAQQSIPRPLMLLLLFGIAWFAIVIYGFSSRPQPRYYGPFILAICIFAGISLTRLLLPGRPVIFYLLVVGFIASNWLLILARPTPFYVGNTYIKELKESREIIAAEQHIVNAATRFLPPSVAARAQVVPPPGGGLVFKVGKEACLDTVDAQLVRRIDPPLSPISRLITQSGMAAPLPAGLRTRIEALNRKPVTCIVRHQ